jgi:hypothetical protein
MHHYSLKAFQRYHKCNMKHHGLGDLNITNKTKQTTLIHREIWLYTSQKFIKIFLMLSHHGCDILLYVKTTKLGFQMVTN